MVNQHNHISLSQEVIISNYLEFSSNCIAPTLILFIISHLITAQFNFPTLFKVLVINISQKLHFKRKKVHTKWALVQKRIISDSSFCIFEELFIYIFKHTSQKILDKATLKNEIHEPLKNNGLKYILIDWKLFVWCQHFRPYLWMRLIQLIQRGWLIISHKFLLTFIYHLTHKKKHKF